MRKNKVLCVAVALVLALSAVAVAHHKDGHPDPPGYDKARGDVIVYGGCTEEIEMALATTDPHPLLRALYVTQEDAHAAFTDSTGEEIPHYYVWVRLCTAWAAVDPMHVDR